MISKSIDTISFHPNDYSSCHECGSERVRLNINHILDDNKISIEFKCYHCNTFKIIKK